MKRIAILNLLIMSSLFIATAQVKLSFNPKEDIKYEYLTEIQQTIEQTAMGRNLQIKEDVTMKQLASIKSKNVKETEVQFSHQDFSYNLSAPMMKMGYDSKKPNINPSELDRMLEKIFGDVIGKSFTLSIASNGSVNSVSGIGTISESITQAVSVHGQMGEHLSTSMTDQWLGEEAIKGMVEQSLHIYPSDAVNVGESWTLESDYGISNKKSTIKTKYTLKDVKNDAATITVEATVILDPGGGLEGVLTGTQNGSILVDIKTGIPVSSDLKLTINGDVEQQNMKMQMSITANTKTLIKEAE